ncbi:Uncharacterized protein RNJ44_04654 [Nakaseomyces bracarensis]|uniref:37S ribosomal protein S28, mitochondrial n=1 Tax=Nakaseomyces bracarensis TaxID=273131 RepID=A0ABR4NVJ3_9SACH
MFTRTIISKVKPNVFTSFNRCYHATAITQGARAVRFLKAQKRRQKNEARQASIKNSSEMVDPVLGRKDTPFINRIMAEIKEPNVLAGSYDYQEVEKFLGSIEATKQEHRNLSPLNPELAQTETPESLVNRHEAISRILNIRNANRKDSMKIALRLAREEFQRFPSDTGSSEVQAACMTVKIHNLAQHVQNHKKDNANTRILRMLVQQRQSILKYLKRDNPERYYWTLEKLGLNDAAVMQEFNLDRRYMQDFKFFGDRILVKESKKVAQQLRKDERKQKRAKKQGDEAMI